MHARLQTKINEQSYKASQSLIKKKLKLKLKVLKMVERKRLNTSISLEPRELLHEGPLVMGGKPPICPDVAILGCY